MRKYIIVCICILTVSVVLGLNAKLSFDDVKLAVEHVQGSSDDLYKDLEFIDFLAFVIENYTPDSYTVTGAVMDSDGTWRAIISMQRYDPNTPSGIGESFTKELEGLTQTEAKKLVGILKPLEWGNNNENGVFADLLDGIATVGFALGVIVSFVLLLLTFVFDTIATAWCLIQALMYMVGLQATL